MTYHLLSPPATAVTNAVRTYSSFQSVFDPRFALEASSGTDIMLLYQENSNITLPEIQVNKLDAGNVFVNGMQNSSNWTALRKYCGSMNLSENVAPLRMFRELSATGIFITWAMGQSSESEMKR